MINIEKVIDTAVELRISTLKAKENKIINYSDYDDCFQISSTTFDEIKSDRDYKVKIYIKNQDGTVRYYAYFIKIAGLDFIALSPFLIYKSDKAKLEA